MYSVHNTIKSVLQTFINPCMVVIMFLCVHCCGQYSCAHCWSMYGCRNVFVCPLLQQCSCGHYWSMHGGTNAVCVYCCRYDVWWLYLGGVGWSPRPAGSAPVVTSGQCMVVLICCVCPLLQVWCLVVISGGHWLISKAGGQCYCGHYWSMVWAASAQALYRLIGSFSCWDSSVV